MAAETDSTPEKRVAVFDGIRGVAIVLVILSHGWTLWPTGQLDDTAFLRALFSSGDFAVTIFFVVGSFLATRSLLRRAERTRSGSSPADPRDTGVPPSRPPVVGGLHPGVAFLRRFIRLSGQVFVLLLVVALVTTVDATDTYPDTETRTSLVRIGTYTWNWYLRDNSLTARADLGHLWYLSVEMQVFALTVLLVYLLRYRPTWLLLSLGLLLLACFTWRNHVYETESVYQALLRTTVRMDAPLTGAVAAAAVPYLSRFARFAPTAGAISVVVLLPIMHWTGDPAGYFSWPGLALDASLAAFVISTSLASPWRWTETVVGLRPLAFLGEHSLSLYLWHYPVFWFVSRHSFDWSWQQRTLVAMSITFLIALVSERLVETRVRRLLQSRRWQDLERGFAHFLRQRLREARSRKAST